MRLDIPTVKSTRKSENDIQESTPTPRSSVPKWLPISLLAFTTAALAVPLVLLRRHRANTLTGSLTKHPAPPPRRSNSSTLQFIPVRPTPSTTHTTRQQESSTEYGDESPSDTLHAAKAIGIATFLVTIGAASAVWGVKSYLGVQTPREFAEHMRSAILARVPSLASRVHRPPDTQDPAVPYLDTSPDTGTTEWNWADAEKRLKDAFDKGGLPAWGVAAMREAEAEDRVERVKREMEK